MRSSGLQALRLLGVPEGEDRIEDLFCCAQAAEVAFTRPDEQLAVRNERHDLFGVGERHDVVGIAVPPADGYVHIAYPEAPQAGEEDDVGGFGRV